MKPTYEQRRQDKKICEGAPESCFNCPFPDCINNGFAKVEETAFVEQAFDGSRHKKKYKKRDKNDKQENQG